VDDGATQCRLIRCRSDSNTNLIWGTVRMPSIVLVVHPVWATEKRLQPKLARESCSGRKSRRVVIFDWEKNLYGKLEARRLHSAKCLIPGRRAMLSAQNRSDTCDSLTRRYRNNASFGREEIGCSLRA
jgi:hypothetical protein